MDMNTQIGRHGAAAKHAALSLMLATTMVAPFAAGCGNNGGGGMSQSGSNSQPPRYETVPAPTRQQPSQGMSTGKKVAILAGTAALIYLYNRHKNAQGAGAQGQYYRSKNGRIYYRDAQGNAVYVTPPAGGIQVPASEADRYNRAAQTGDWDLGGSDNSYGGGTMVPPGPRGAY